MKCDVTIFRLRHFPTFGILLPKRNETGFSHFGQIIRSRNPIRNLKASSCLDKGLSVVAKLPER